MELLLSPTLLSALLLRPGDISVPLRGAALTRGAGGAAAFSDCGVSRRGAALTLGAGAGGRSVCTLINAKHQARACEQVERAKSNLAARIIWLRPYVGSFVIKAEG